MNTKRSLQIFEPQENCMIIISTVHIQLKYPRMKNTEDFKSMRRKEEKSQKYAVKL